MNGFRFMKGVVVSLATFGVVCPQTQLLAEGSQAAIRSSAKASEGKATADVLLTRGGTLSGRVVDHTGKAIEGAQVTVRNGKKEITKTRTDKEGVYSFKNIKSGVYEIHSSNTVGTFRVWTDQTAPPATKEYALLVMGENGARGQFGAVDPTLVLLTGGIIASVVLGAITLDQVNKIPTSP
jgi:hypothetical protein